MIVSKKRINWNIGAILGCILIFMFILNSMSPLVNDDYSYFVKTSSIKTIFVDEFHQYMNWTGRSVVHVILRFFTKLPKPFFNVYNSLAFTVLIYQVVTIGSINKEKVRKNFLLKVLATFAVLWIFTPSFQEVYLWMSGSINYLTAIVIMLSFITIFHSAVINTNSSKRYVKSSTWKIVGVFLLGIAAGWCNENTSAGTLLIIIGYVLINKFINKRKSEAWMFAGITGNLIGFLFMVLAPGNEIRSTYFNRNDLSLVWKILDAIPTISKGLQENAIFPIFIALALIIYSFNKKELTAEKLVKVLFFIGGLATIGVLAVSPAAISWSRSYFGGMIFIFISLLIGLFELLEEKKENNSIITSAILSYIVVLFILTFFSGITDIYKNYVAYDRQYQAIKGQKAAGKRSITVPPLENNLKTKYALRNTDDITADPNNKKNKNAAAYWGVDSIKISK